MGQLRIRAARNADVVEIEGVVEHAFAASVRRTGIRLAPLALDRPTVMSALGASAATRDDRVVGVLVELDRRTEHGFGRVWCEKRAA